MWHCIEVSHWTNSQHTRKRQKMQSHTMLWEVILLNICGLWKGPPCMIDLYSQLNFPCMFNSTYTLSWAPDSTYSSTSTRFVCNLPLCAPFQCALPPCIVPAPTVQLCVGWHGSTLSMSNQLQFNPPCAFNPLTVCSTYDVCGHIPKPWLMKQSSSFWFAMALRMSKSFGCMLLWPAPTLVAAYPIV